MKKNFLLFVILFTFVGLAYFLDNIKNPQLAKDLFDFTSFSTIKLEKVEIENKEGEVFIKDIKYPASVNRLNLLVTRLSDLKIKNEIIGKKRIDLFANDFFTPAIEFQIDKQIFQISQANQLTGSYFIWAKSIDKIYEVNDTYVNEGLYRSEVEADILKYDNLVNFLKADYRYYILNNIKYLKDFSKVKRIKISNSSGDYEIDLEKMITLPPALPSLPYNIEKLKSIILDLKQITVFDIKDVAEFKNLKTKISSILIDNDFKIDVYQTLGDTPGYFVYIPDHKYIYQVALSSILVTQMSVQDYWLKDINFLKSTQKGKWNPLILTYSDEVLSLEFKIDDELKIKEKNERILQARVATDLLALIAGVLKVSTISSELGKAEKVLTLNIGAKDYGLYRTKDHLIVSDNDLYYHYDRKYLKSSFLKTELLNEK